MKRIAKLSLIVMIIVLLVAVVGWLANIAVIFVALTSWRPTIVSGFRFKEMVGFSG